MGTARQDREDELRGLELTWGSYYEIRESLGMWRAVRGGRTLSGKTPHDLRVAIIRDFSEERHPR